MLWSWQFFAKQKKVAFLRKEDDYETLCEYNVVVVRCLGDH
jgi:hypothetical protein